MADSLNGAKFSTKNLEDESYYATAGFLADGIVTQILNDMTQRFPSEPAPVFDRIDDLPLETIIAYGYLNADIEFEHPFYVNNNEFDFQDSNGTVSGVTSFCTRSYSDSLDLVREQVDVLYYKQSDQAGEAGFAVDLCIHTNPYQVVLACVPQQNTLGKTLAVVEQKWCLFTF